MKQPEIVLRMTFAQAMHMATMCLSICLKGADKACFFIENFIPLQEHHAAQVIQDLVREDKMPYSTGELLMSIYRSAHAMTQEERDAISKAAAEDDAQGTNNVFKRQ